MRTMAVFAAALVACALVLWFGPVLAQAVLRWGGAGAATGETVYAAFIFGSLILIALAGGAWCGVDPLNLGLRRVPVLGLGAAIGAASLLVAIALAWLAGTLGRGDAPPGDPGLLLWGSAVILFAATAEEIYFRGWVQPALVRDLSVPAAITLSALAFAALHVLGGARGAITLANLFLGGLLFGLLAARGAGLAGAIGAHFAWNWTEQIAFGLDPNPGVGSFGAWMNLDLSGRALWGGSSEGINGSVGMTIALFALLIPVAIFMRGRPVRRGECP